MDQKTVELAPFGNIEIDGDKYPQDLSYSVSTVYCETPEEKWNPSPDIHLGKLEHWFSIFLTASGSPKFQELSSRLCCCSHQLEVARGCPAKINMVTQAAPSREETPQNRDNSYSRGGRPRDSATWYRGQSNRRFQDNTRQSCFHWKLRSSSREDLLLESQPTQNPEDERVEEPSGESQEIPQIQVTEDHSNSCQPDIYRSTEDNELIETEIEGEWQNVDHSEPVNFGVNEVTGEKQQDDQDPEEVITYREIRTPDETLLLGVAIPDQPQLTKCVAFVDTGAEVSLITARCFNMLDPEKYPRMSTAYRSVEGIGRNKFPVMGEVIIAFKLATDYMLRSNRFIIIPDEVTEYDVVIGYDVLKREHLLPDPCAKELVVRRGNKVQTVAVDMRKEQNLRLTCVVAENIILQPKEYTPIEVKTRPELSEDQVMLVESEEKLPKKVSIDPALVKFHQNRAILIIRNDDDRPKKLQKGSIIGKMETLEDSHPSI
ncbi:hypothetical protein Avbf_18805, partial [Armadillidium vulgare]